MKMSAERIVKMVEGKSYGDDPKRKRKPMDVSCRPSKRISRRNIREVITVRNGM